MYEIETNVPLPATRKRHNYPYEDMQVGESFWVMNGNMNALCNSNRIKGKKLGRKFVCRKEGEGVRVWRLE